MQILEVLKKAKDSKVIVYVENEKLFVKVPKDHQVDIQVMDDIKTYKAEILSFLLKKEQILGGEHRVSIPRINRSDLSLFPLSHAQERLWFIDKLQGSDNYLIPTILKIEGDLLVKNLELAFLKIIERHEILRTVYVEVNGEPFQKVLQADHWRLSVIEISPEELNNVINEEVNVQFDLSKEVTLKASLIKTGHQKYTLVFVIHHISTDAWSTPILVNELITFYSAFSKKEVPEFTELPMQYLDYAGWQKRTLTENVLKDKLSYWLDRLDDVQVLDFPTDYPRPAMMSSRGKTLEFKINKALVNRMVLLSGLAGTTLNMTLLSVFKVLLYKYTQQEDICIGMPVSNRGHHELNSLVGFFVNSLVIRSHLSEDMTFSELLSAVKENSIAAFEHQDVPFEKLVDCLDIKRDLSRSPIFQIVYTFQANEREKDIDFGNLKIKYDYQESDLTKYDLIFNVKESSDGVNLLVQYCTDLFAKETIEQMVLHFRKILDQVAENPGEKLRDIEILTPSERNRLLYGYNIKKSSPYTGTFIDEFESQVLKSPENIALRIKGSTMSYQELNEKANKLSHYLKESYAISTGDIVALMTNRSEWYLIAILGIMKAGAAYIPIEIDFPRERKQHILDEVNAKVLIIESEVLVEAMEFGVSTFSIDIMFDKLKTSTKDPVRLNFDLNSLAYLIYTSGSTGMPKGIMIEHKGLINLCSWHVSQYDVSEKSIGALFSGISFDGSVWEIFPYLICGASLCPITDNYMRYEVTKLSDFIVQHKLTHIYLPTQICLDCINANLELGDTTILTGGELLIMPKESKLKIVNNYGPTENTAITTCYELNAGACGIIPIGKPIPNTSVYVLNKHGQLVPEGVYGELCIAGNSLARGYFGSVAKKDDKFVNDPFDLGGKRLMYKSGDIVRWTKDGNLEFKGRTDDQVKIRGFRVELAEIEMLLNGDLSIINSLVLYTEDSSGHKQIIAFVVPGKRYNQKSIRRHLKSKLPGYMQPALIIKLNSLPVNRNGKINKSELIDLAKKHKRENDNYVIARNEVERKLTKIWEAVLLINEIGVHDNFFEIGGHSLLATKVISKIKSELKAIVTVPDIFNYPTINELSYLIKNNKRINKKLGEFIDLELESQIDIDFSIIDSLTPFEKEPKSIFLTGATGFIGTFILSELLKNTNASIYCLVRADDQEDALERILEKLNYYELFDESKFHQIIAIAGDLSKPNFGMEVSDYDLLSEKIDFIFHSATHMDHFSSFERLKRVNVQGNIDVIKFSLLKRSKKIIYISTVGKVFGGDYGRWVDEDESRDGEKHKYSSGYGGTKWVGEKIMSKAMNAGLPVQIHRLGLITGDNKTGKIPKEQWFTKLLASCYEIGYFTPVFPVPITPVDFVCKAVVGLGLSKEVTTGCFHLINPYRENLRNIFVTNNTTGRKIIATSIQKLLLKILKESDHLYLPIMPFIDYEDQEFINAMNGNYPLKKYVRNRNRYAVKKTFKLLKQVADLEFPNLENYYGRYLLCAIEEFKSKLLSFKTINEHES